MSYIKFEQRHLGDARWLDASPAAFVVHVWALDYCNSQATDGVIPIKVAHRLNCPVEPTEIPDAFKSLIELDVWRLEDDKYVCDGFLSHGIAAAEQERTRDKWAADKRRRRLHDVGNHDLCTSKSKCVAVKDVHQSTSGNTESPPVDKWTTRPDPTPKGEGRGEAGSLGGSAPKGATPRSPADSTPSYDDRRAERGPLELPRQLQMKLSVDSPTHTFIVVEAPVDEGYLPSPSMSKALETVRKRLLQAMPATQRMRESHGCWDDEDGCNLHPDPDNELLVLSVPADHVGTWWSEVAREAADCLSPTACTECGQRLLYDELGRTMCERCRLDQEAAS